MNLKTEYTLEKHLNLICEQDTDYKILNSIWVLNKQKLEAGLSTISTNFPHYSLHDSSHSKTIIKNIESLLGEDRISTLGATETFLLLMGSYTHDIGMILFYEVIQKEWNTKEFKNYLNWVIEYSSDKDLIEAATRVLKPLESDIDKNDYWALEVRDSVTVIVADYFRSKHNERGQDYINNNSTFKTIADNFYSEQLPARFFKLLARVAYGHGTDFYKIINSLPYQENGLKSDKIHPKFIAAMIRMGDYLDVDDGRFNLFSIKSLKKMPESSDDHRKKHSSVTHLLISPESIEVTVDCETDPVYRQARFWFDGLIKEVQLLSKEWISIVPKNLGGLPPVILDNKILILDKGRKPKDELRNLKFAISNERIFDMLEGGALYEDADFVFLREIVQNALDASKIQLWKDIQSGMHDLVLLPHLKEQTKKEEVSYADIKFPDDIPDNIYGFYPIKLSIKWVGDKYDLIEITCEDKGTGISDDTLVRMTSHVGESRKADKKFDEFKDSMPYWLKPTGAFGIGLQSLFLVTETFSVETKADEETEAKEIIFRSAKRNAYCSVSPFKDRTKRGSKIKLQICKDKFDLSKESNSYDYFTDTRGGKYPHLLLDYINKQFKEIDNLELDFLDEGSYLLKETKDKKKEQFSTPEIYDEHYKIRYKYDEDSLSFIVDENKFGSQIKLRFFGEKRDSRLSAFSEEDYYNNKFYLRNMPLDFSLNTFEYFFIEWNLLNSDSDKIVGLSRNNILDNERKKQRNQFNEIANEILPHIYHILTRDYESIQLKQDKLHLIHFNLACSLLEHNSSFINNLKLDLFGDQLLPLDIAKSYDNKSISFRDFFNAKNIIVHQFYRGNYDEMSYSIDNYENFLYVDQLYRIYSIYSLKKILFYGDHFNQIFFYIKNLEKKNNFIPIEIDENSTLFDIINNDRAPYDIDIYSRFIYPLSDYKNICVKRDSGFNLILPFKDYKQFDDFLEDLKLSNLSDLNSYIKEKYIPLYINDKIVDYTIENKAIKEPITKEEILDTYQRMLVDIYDGYLKDKEKQKKSKNEDILEEEE